MRAAAADPASIVVCTGYAQGLGLVLRVLRATASTTVAFEDPGDGDIGRARAGGPRAGMRRVPVAVDEHGHRRAALAAQRRAAWWS